MRPIAPALLASLVACAAGPALKDYPRSAIDRPYTLPSGVASWHIGAALIEGRDATSSRITLGIPLGWDIPLTDDWNLLVGGLGLAHQFVNDGRQRLGATLGASLGFGSEGILLGPSIHIAHRLRLSRRWAWDSALFGSANRWTQPPGWSWGAGGQAGPVFQATETLALSAAAALTFARNYLLTPSEPLPPSGRANASVALGLGWSVGRQWDLGMSVGYGRTANANGYRQVWGSLSVSNLW